VDDDSLQNMIGSRVNRIICFLIVPSALDTGNPKGMKCSQSDAEKIL
jgi:hypothetical protein